MRCEFVDKTADEFFMFLQSSQSGSGVMDSCEGSQLYPPTPPIMLQVNCKCALYVLSFLSEKVSLQYSQTHMYVERLSVHVLTGLEVTLSTL